MITENLNKTEERITNACIKAQRLRSEVTLVAVSKTKPVEAVKEAYLAGIRDFGENYVQEIVDKTPQLPSDIRWHMIGHLQRNKVKYIIDKVCMIHSVDSVRLAKTISEEAIKHHLCMDILLEVNVADEETKFGFKLNEVESAVYEISSMPGLKIRGLMTSAPITDAPESNRSYFKALHDLCVDLKLKNIDNTSMDLLSMGMTGDFEVAIEEGSNMVRIGTAIFGAREYHNQ